MADAKRDGNNVTAVIGVLNTDGVTPTRAKASPSSHILDVSDGSTGSDLGQDRAERDNNRVTTLVASDANGTIINLYINSSGALLIDTN